MARIFLALLLILALPARGAEVRIDAAKRYQTITGWEATLDLSDTPARPGWGAFRTELLDRAVSEMGITRVRLEVRAGAETRSGEPARFIAGGMTYKQYKPGYYRPTNDNDDPHKIDWSGFDFSEMDWHVEHSLLPLKRRLEARGQRLFVNLLYVAFRREPYLHQQKPEEYAEFILAATLHLKNKWGITPDIWEAVLEPENARVKGPWSPPHLAESIAAASRRLKAAGFRPAFSAPSVANAKNALPYLQVILRNAEAASVLREVSYHRYGGGKPRNIQAIAREAGRHGLDTAMLEWWNGRADARVLIEDLTLGNVSAWQGNALSGHFAPYQRGQLRLKPINRVRRLIYANVPPGSVRIGASTKARDLRVVAFVLPGGGQAVFVHAPRKSTVTLRGLKPGRAHLSFEGEGKGRARSIEREPVSISANGKIPVTVPGTGLLALIIE